MLFFIGILESLENDDSRCEVDSFWLILCAYEIKDFEDVNRYFDCLADRGWLGLSVFIDYHWLWQSLKDLDFGLSHVAIKVCSIVIIIIFYNSIVTINDGGGFEP